MDDQRYKDPHIDLKERDVRINLVYHESYPVFGLVEFNIWGACNRRCEFCPVSSPDIFINRKKGEGTLQKHLRIKHIRLSKTEMPTWL